MKIDQPTPNTFPLFLSSALIYADRERSAVITQSSLLILVAAAGYTSCDRRVRAGTLTGLTAEKQSVSM